MSTHSSSAIRILLLEDSPQDAELVTRTLRRSDPRFEVVHVDRAATFREALAEREPDVVLSGSAVMDFNALDALRVIQSTCPAVPFLLVFPAFEQTAADCLKEGASDFIHKTDLSRLVPSIVSALELRGPLRKLSQRQRQVLRLMAEGWSTREIARELEVSIKTVETHRAEVMKRLGVRDLASLVRYAIRIGIVARG